MGTHDDCTPTQNSLRTVEEDQRQSVKEEFEDRVAHLSRELTIENTKFQEYRSLVFKDMQSYLDEVALEATLFAFFHSS